MANLSALVIELRKPEYAALTHEEAAKRVNQKTETVRRPIPAETVQRIAIINGLWGKLKIAATNPNLPEIPRGAAIAFIDWAESERPFNPDSEPIKALSAVLVQFSLATTAQIAELTKAGDVVISWTEHVGIGEVGIGYVINARNTISEGVRP